MKVRKELFKSKTLANGEQLTMYIVMENYKQFIEGQTALVTMK